MSNHPPVIDKKTGFTLIELLVVISIISFLSAIVIAAISTARLKVRDTQRIAAMKQLQIAMQLYYEKNGHYPEDNAVPFPLRDVSDCNGDTSISGKSQFAHYLRGLVTGGFMPVIPDDPLHPNNTGASDEFCYTYISKMNHEVDPPVEKCGDTTQGYTIKFVPEGNITGFSRYTDPSGSLTTDYCITVP